MTKLRCVVERITYQNAENGYSVMKVKVKGYDDLVTLVGNLLEVPAGSVLLCEGEWRVDKRYGQQFQCETWEEVMPATAYGIKKYLGSGLVKGIGPKFAKLIVGHFGTDTIEVIETDIERLYEVPGIGKKRVEKIRESWEKQKDIKNVMLFLQGFGVSTAYAAKIYRQYGKESIDKVKENPYRLADDIWGIGFKTADGIARKMGYEMNDERRLRSGLIYTLNQLADEGHCYAEEQQLIATARQLLEADEECIRTAMTHAIETEDLMLDGTGIYLPPFYYAECGTANRLSTLVHTKEVGSIFTARFDLAKLQRETGIEYDEVQVEAIRQAIASKVMVLTGGPGTGKTTTTKAIITALQSAGMRILLAAPTGRAAKRMSEATGMEAKTIHRLLEYNPQDGYKRNDENPLEGDALIVDECSMIDIILMNNLTKALPTTMRLVLVGDIDQLPSVGAGNVLRDIIDSGVIPVVRLTRIFRQAQSSRIVMSAHAINRGCFPDISNGQHTDFFMKQEEPEKVAETIVSLVRDRLPKAYRQPTANIQVLTPMQRGMVGAANLNMALQQALNHNTAALVRGGYTYKEGDRVMQLRNNYDKDVYNGDLGYVHSMDMEERTLTVDFDGQLVEYEVSELDELTLAYATTIHKSQGSEYPIVVMPVLMTHYVMLQRNLIYTGITRAKKICVLVGQTKALAYAIHNMKVLKRNTRLKERLAPTATDSIATALNSAQQYALPTEEIQMAAEDRVQYGDKGKP